MYDDNFPKAIFKKILRAKITMKFHDTEEINFCIVQY